MARAKKTRISVLNWMGTLLLFAIPGVNLLTIIGIFIFAKSPSKKTFAGAVLIWMLIAVIAAVAALLLLPEEAANLADLLRQTAAGM